MKKEKTAKFIPFEAYNTQQPTFEKLYAESRGGNEFTNLIDLILSHDNIMLAFRELCRNSYMVENSHDKDSVSKIGNMNPDEIVEHVRFIAVGSQHGYRPKPVQLSNFETMDGITKMSTRPCAWDYMLQQSIKQILEPILEAKFSDNNYGNRKFMTFENTFGALYKRIQVEHKYCVLELDLPDFESHVDHEKLIHQLWSLNIHDEKLLEIIRRMLQGTVYYPDGHCVQKASEGIVQSGALLTLLMNVYLNEFDYWIDSQWINNPNVIKLQKDRTAEGKGIDRGHAFTKLRRTNLKEMYLLRISGSIRIITRSFKEAERLKFAIIDWMHNRLHIDIREDDIHSVDVRKKWMHLLGYKIRVRDKGGKWTIESHIDDNAFDYVRTKLTDQAKRICKPKRLGRNLIDELLLYNRLVLRFQGYYQYATDIQLDFDKINWNVMKILKNRLNGMKPESKGMFKTTGRPLSEREKSEFGETNLMRFIKFGGQLHPVYPISAIKTWNPSCARRKDNPYAVDNSVREEAKIRRAVLEELYQRGSYDKVYISKIYDQVGVYSRQNGRCAITGQLITNIDQIDFHHVIPRSSGGEDNADNLVAIMKPVHKLIHATEKDTIKKYLEIIQPSDDQIKIINQYRVKAHNKKIPNEMLSKDKNNMRARRVR